jgi:hypothetical protein
MKIYDEYLKVEERYAIIDILIRLLTYGIVISPNDCIANSGGEKEGNISSCNTCDDKTPDIFSLCFSCGQKRNLGYLCFEIGYYYNELIQRRFVITKNN